MINFKKYYPFLINILSATTIALFLSQVFHEGMHALAGIIVGTENVKLSLFAANALNLGSTNNAHIIFVESSAVILNIIIGTLALAFYKYSKGINGITKYTFLLIFTFSYLLAFGYMIIDSAFYVHGAKGDFKSILGIYDGSPILRLILFIIGCSGWLYTYFFVAKAMWIFNFNGLNRKTLSALLMIIPYLFTSLVMVILSVINHPIPNGEGIFIVFLQYFFGNSALFTGYFLSSYWLDYKKPSSQIELSNKLDYIYLSIAVLLWFVMIFVLLPVK